MKLIKTILIVGIMFFVTSCDNNSATTLSSAGASAPFLQQDNGVISQINYLPTSDTFGSIATTDDTFLVIRKGTLIMQETSDYTSYVVGTFAGIHTGATIYYYCDPNNVDYNFMPPRYYPTEIWVTYVE